MTRWNVIPDDLVREVSKGEDVAFILWHGFDKRSPRFPEYKDLKINFDEIAQMVSAEINDDAEICPAHIALAHLSVSTIYSTAYDSRIKSAFRQEKISCSYYTDDGDLRSGLSKQKKVFHLLGLPTKPKSLVVTKSGYGGLRSKKDSLITYLKNDLSGKTCIFLGITPEEFDDDSLLSSLYPEIAKNLKAEVKPPFIVCGNASSYLKSRAPDTQKIIPIDLESEDFLLTLEKLVSTLESSVGKNQTYHAQVASLPLPSEGPYKFLNYFEAKDRRIYFGRETESLELVSQIKANRINILSSPSGRGKTSLLKAGIIPRLEAEGWSVYYFRISETKQGIQDFGNYVGGVDNKKSIVIFDQAEELFTRDLRVEQQKAFAESLAKNPSNRDFHLLVCLRYEYVGQWEELMSNVQLKDLGQKANRFLLGPLGRAQTKQAINEPAKLFKFTFAPDLTDLLLNDLEKTEFDPAQLQIICSTLYKLFKSKKKIHLADFEALGGTQSILERYLNDALLNLNEGEEQQKAKIILKSLITPRRTKIPLSSKDVFKRVAYAKELSQTETEQLLRKLQNARIVRVLDNGYFELAHDRLAAKVGEWLTDEDRARLNAVYILKQGVEDFEREGKIISNDDQKLIFQSISVLDISSKDFIVLLISALHPTINNREFVRHWLNWRIEQSLNINELIKILYEFLQPTSFTPNKHKNKYKFTLPSDPHFLFETESAFSVVTAEAFVRAFWLLYPLSRQVLFKILQSRFDLSEIKLICMRLGVEFDNLPQGGKDAKIIALLSLCLKEGELDKLVGIINAERPDVCHGISVSSDSEMFQCYTAFKQNFSLEEADNLASHFNDVFKGWKRSFRENRSQVAHSIVRFFQRKEKLNNLKLLIAYWKPQNSLFDLNSQIYVALNAGYDLEELKTLCFDLGQDSENFGQTKDLIIKGLLGEVDKLILVKSVVSPEEIGKDNVEVFVRRQMVSNLNEMDLYQLCSHFGVNLEEVPGRGFAGKCRELILYLKRHSVFASFVYFIYDQRPDILKKEDAWSFVIKKLEHVNQAGNLFASALGETFTEKISFREKIDTSTYRRAIRDVLMLHFSRNELIEICFALDVDHENLDSESLSSFAIGLYLFLERQNRLDELYSHIISKRSDLKDTLDKAKQNDPQYRSQ